jgi:hypothetical protein
MQHAQLAELLELDVGRLQRAIKACEFKFGEMPIAGLGSLECNVPKEELERARARLREASRAQARQSKARTQLSMRVNAPTGTATFDTLVKLVSEAKAAGVEVALIRLGERKLQQMEEQAAAKLKAGPLAAVSHYFPFLHGMLANHAMSLVEQAESRVHEEDARKRIAAHRLREMVGGWRKGSFKDKSLNDTNVDDLKVAIMNAASEGLPQEDIELGRLKLMAAVKYQAQVLAGQIKLQKEREAELVSEEAFGAGKPGDKPKKKFKNYGYVKKVVEEE